MFSSDRTDTGAPDSPNGAVRKFVKLAEGDPSHSHFYSVNLQSLCGAGGKVWCLLLKGLK